jgi:hypothetical protein
VADYVEVTSQSWGTRLKNSFSGILFGILMILGGMTLLFWNEGRAVRRAKALTEGESNVVSITPGQPTGPYEGKLIHFSAEATTTETLRDSAFDVSALALRLRREVEMFQWEESRRSEEKKKLGGGTETITTYSYSKSWSSSPINSGSFKQSQEHQNPAFPIDDKSFIATEITAGNIRLSPSFTSQLDSWTPFTVDREQAEVGSDTLGRPMQVSGSGFYAGSNASSPEIGDLRIGFSVVLPSMASFVGQLRAGQLVPYQARSGSSLSLVANGAKSGEEMFKQARQSNTFLTWMLRLGGTFLLFIAWSAILKPLSVLADVIPMFGNLVEKGVGGVAGALALMLSLGTIAFAWIFYRPLLGITLLLLCVGLLVWIVRSFRRSKDTMAIPPPPPTAVPPPPPA